MDRKTYYKDCKLWLPENPQWRIFRFRLQDYSFKTTFIRSEEQLRKELLRWEPLDVYYSAAQWLNPKRLKPKCHGAPGFVYADRLLLTLDPVLDFDNKDITKAFDDAMIAIRYVKHNLGYNIKYLLYTGGRGFQVCFEDPFKSNAPAINREQYYEEQLDKFYSLLPDLESLDRKVKDPTRVFRLPMTVHRCGRPSIIFSSYLDHPQSILEAILIAERSERINDTTSLKDGSLQKDSTVHQRKSLAAIQDSSNIFYKYITNRIEGVKDLYAPFAIVYHYNKELISQVQQAYKLDDCYVMKQKDNYGLLFLKPCSFERTLKIMKALNAINISKFNKYRCAYIITSAIFDQDKKEVYVPPLFVDKMLGNTIHCISRPHADMVKFSGVGDLTISEEAIGNKNNQVYVGCFA
jgi:hypothetical protein